MCMVSSAFLFVRLLILCSLSPYLLAELPLRSHDDRMHRVRSDPMLIQPPPAPQQINKYGVGSDEDPVHAGAYSKRPNRNESMVFLKKLVSHQRGDAQPMQSLMSPPDSPMRKLLHAYYFLTR